MKFLFSILMFNCGLFAQNSNSVIGILVGSEISSFYGNKNYLYFSQGKAAPLIGLYYENSITNKLHQQFEVRYNEKGDKFIVDFENNVYATINIQYLDAAYLLKLKLIGDETSGVSFLMGPVGSMRLKSTINISSDSEDQYSLDKKTKRYDAGILSGFNWGNMQGLGVQMRYQIGLLKTVGSLKNSSISICMYYSFEIKP